MYKTSCKKYVCSAESKCCCPVDEKSRNNIDCRRTEQLAEFRSPRLKKSISFFSSKELFSIKVIPVLGAGAFLGLSLNVMAADETFFR